MRPISTSKKKDADEEDIFIPQNNDFGEASDDSDLDERAHNKLLTEINSISTNKKKVAQRKVRTAVGTGISGVSTEDLLERIQSHKLKKAVSHLKTLPAPLEKPQEQKIKRSAGFEKVNNEVKKWEKIVDIRRKAETLSFPLEKPAPVSDDESPPPKQETELEKEVYSLLQGFKPVEKKKTRKEKAINRAMSLAEAKERYRQMMREKEMRRRFEDKARRLNKSKSKKYHRILKHEKLRKQKAELEELEKTDPEAALEKIELMEKMRIEERMNQRHKASKWAKFQGIRATRDKEAMAALKENARLHRELKMKWAKKNENNSDDDEDDDSAQAGEEDMEVGTFDPTNLWTAALGKSQSSSALTEEEEDKSFSKFRQFWEEVNQRKLQEKEAQAVVEQIERNSQEDNMEAEEEGVEESDDDTDQLSDKKEKTSVDCMFNEAESNLKKKVKRKLEKIGITIAEEKEWTRAKKHKPEKKGRETDATVVEDFDFSSKLNEKNIEVRQRVRTMEEAETLTQQINPRSGIQEAYETLARSTDPTELRDEENEDDEDESGEKNTQNKKIEVDPTKFIQVTTKKIQTSIPDKAVHGEEGFDDSEEEEEEEDPEDVIREAFADDYLIEEFRSQKEAAVKESEIKDVDLTLPGWGSWTGPNIKVSNTKKKKNKFWLRAQKKKRKDSHLGHVIYNEKADVHKKLRETMVSELPKHFTTVKDFEASIRAPVGREFVPENVHSKLTVPAVTTKMGSIIEPMTKNELLAKH